MCIVICAFSTRCDGVPCCNLWQKVLQKCFRKCIHILAASRVGRRMWSACSSWSEMSLYLHFFPSLAVALHGHGQRDCSEHFRLGGGSGWEFFAGWGSLVPTVWHARVFRNDSLFGSVPARRAGRIWFLMELHLSTTNIGRMHSKPLPFNCHAAHWGNQNKSVAIISNLNHWVFWLHFIFKT